MKKPISILALTTCLISSASAQPPAVATTNPPSAFYATLQAIGTIGAAWLNTNTVALAAHKWTAAPYLTYAPNCPDKFGGGVFIAYQVSDYLGAGIGLDYLGQLTMPSGQMTLKLPIQPLRGLGLNWTFTPFAFAGGAVPVGSSSGNGVALIVGTGAAIKVADFTVFGKQANVVLGGAITRWSNAGEYGGEHFEIFPAFNLEL